MGLSRFRKISSVGNTKLSALTLLSNEGIEGLWMITCKKYVISADICLELIFHGDILNN